MARGTEQGKFHAIPTAGEIFLDGAIFELVRPRSDSPEIELLAWHDRVLKIGARLAHTGRWYKPQGVDASVRRAMSLPTHVGPPEETRTLFMATRELLGRHLDQSESCREKIVFGIFASWLSDFLPTSPLIWIVTPVGSPKKMMLQLLRLLCRRPLLLGGVNRGNFACLPMSLQPTLLLDEPDFRPEMLKLLCTSSCKGTSVPKGHGIVSLCGPKIVASHTVPSDALLESHALRVVLNPAAAARFPLSARVEQQIAEEFQPRFLSYRLRNCRSVRVPEFDVNRLSVPTQELALSLGAAIVGDPEIQNRILPLLDAQDEELRTNRSTTPEAVLLESLLSTCHTKERVEIRGSELAKAVCAIYAGRGIEFSISPESIGWALKKLGIPTGRLGSAANGVKLIDATRRLVHQLAIHYDVRALQARFHVDCKHCNEIKETRQGKNGS